MSTNLVSMKRGGDGDRTGPTVVENGPITIVRGTKAGTGDVV